MEERKMRIMHALGLGAALALLAPAGCAELETGESVQGAWTLNAWTLNGLGYFKVEGQHIANQPLGQNPDTAGLADDSIGRGVLRYAARCALEATDTLWIQDTRGGSWDRTDPMDGLIGLLPQWRKRGLDRSEQAWLMACMLTHVNAYGQAVPLSLRGHHPALAADKTERAEFPYFEGAFWGSFGERSEGGEVEYEPNAMYACYGEDQLIACDGNASLAAHVLWRRVCARGGCDNFQVVGACRDYDGRGVYACGAEYDGIVSDCRDQPSTSAQNWPPGTNSWGAKVANSYLAKISCDVD
jgi:hypothetical protein